MCDAASAGQEHTAREQKKRLRQMEKRISKLDGLMWRINYADTLLADTAQKPNHTENEFFFFFDTVRLNGYTIYNTQQEV